jgi:hypothetical protein
VQKSARENSTRNYYLHASSRRALQQQNGTLADTAAVLQRFPDKIVTTRKQNCNREGHMVGLSKFGEEVRTSTKMDEKKKSLCYAACTASHNSAQ